VPTSENDHPKTKQTKDIGYVPETGQINSISRNFERTKNKKKSCVYLSIYADIQSCRKVFYILEEEISKNIRGKIERIKIYL